MEAVTTAAGYVPLGDSAYVDYLPSENPLDYTISCLSDCAYPCAAFCCCAGKLQVKPAFGSYMSSDPWWKSFKFHLCHRMQSWLIRHPLSEAYCCCCLRPCITVHDLASYRSVVVDGFREEIGDVWCDNMKVEIANQEIMREMMTAPQGGGAALGQAWLRPHKLPHTKDGKPLFLLSLANGLFHTPTLADESKRQLALRGMIFKYFISPASAARQTDEVASRLFAELRAAKAADPDQYVYTKAGLAGFMLKYMHYVLLGLDLSAEQFDNLYSLYFGPSPELNKTRIILVLMRYVGAVYECLGDADIKALPARRQYAVELYKQSPAMQDFADEALPIDEFLDAFVTILGLAGLQGPLGAATHLLLNYMNYWRESDWPLADREKVRLYVLEAMRLRPAVFGSGLTAPRPFKARIGDTLHHFPAGTPVHLNFFAINRDKRVWGESAEEFDPEGHAALLPGPGKIQSGCPYPNFNSWGGIDGDGSDDTDDAHSRGRECPGKELSLTMLTDLVIAMFDAGVPSPPSSPPMEKVQMER